MLGRGLRELARRWDRESAASRWAYYRDFGRSRLLVIDSRAARVLSEGRRDMVDADEWDWIVEHSRGSFDHLIVVDHAAGVRAAGDPLPRGVERGDLRRLLGISRGAARRTSAARGRPRALGGVPALVRTVGRPSAHDQPRIWAASRPRRSRFSAAMFIRPIWRRSTSAKAPVRAASTRLSARRFEIRLSRFRTPRRQSDRLSPIGCCLLPAGARLWSASSFSQVELRRLTDVRELDRRACSSTGRARPSRSTRRERQAKREHRSNDFTRIELFAGPSRRISATRTCDPIGSWP